jgi:transcriptional regulator with XRE-family HTH domain
VSSGGTIDTRRLERRLMRARLSLGLTQAALAVILEVSQGALSRCENGNRHPSAEHSQRIAIWLQHHGL